MKPRIFGVSQFVLVSLQAVVRGFLLRRRVIRLRKQRGIAAYQRMEGQVNGIVLEFYKK